jgi:hypothetical protein
MAVLGPGLIGGIGIIAGLPALLLLLLTAGAAGFVVAYPGGGQWRLSATVGAGANVVSFLVVSIPFVPSVLMDPEFRQAALGVAGVLVPFVVIGVGYGAVVGFGGAYVARDVARRSLRGL